MSETFDLDYFEGVPEGTDEMQGSAITIPYLSMIQPNSELVNEGKYPGQWYNSATREVYGPSVDVIPLSFKVIWVERSSEAPFTTVGRYEPHSIRVTERKPANGKGFPIMTNPETGNKVQELFAYALMLKDRPDDGIMFFAPTAISMRACKTWNTLMRSATLPNGSRAPICAYSWSLNLDLVKNPQRDTEQLAAFSSVTKGSLVEKELFLSKVKPNLRSDTYQLQLTAVDLDSTDCAQ